jgi:hypothetical protein
MERSSLPACKKRERVGIRPVTTGELAMSIQEVEITISMSTDRDSFRQQAESEPVKAAESLTPEIKAFENWMMRRGMEQLSKVELQIVREYLGYKLVA